MNLLDNSSHFDLGAVTPMARTATLTAAATEVADTGVVAMEVVDMAVATVVEEAAALAVLAVVTVWPTSAPA